MSKTGQQLINSISAGISAKCTALGIDLTDDISTDQTKLNAISYDVDSKNETWNENLPTRPKS